MAGFDMPIWIAAILLLLVFIGILGLFVVGFIFQFLAAIISLAMAFGEAISDLATMKRGRRK